MVFVFRCYQTLLTWAYVIRGSEAEVQFSGCVHVDKNVAYLSPVYTTLNFWYGTDKIGTRTTFLVLGLNLGSPRTKKVVRYQKSSVV